MKKFQFKLDSVHNVRELREEKERTIFAKLQGEVNQAESRLAELIETRFAAMNRYLDSMKKGKVMNPVEMDLHSKHIASLERAKNRTENEIEEKKSACKEQAVQLSAAAREVKITENLREKQKALYDQELAKLEQIAMDEITTAKYARKTGELNP